jgi:hypothetical protein
MQYDAKDDDGSRYLVVDPLAERDTYYTPKAQFQTTECGGGKYLCLEPLSLRDYFLAAGYPAGGSKQTVKLEHSFYTEDDTRYHWTIKCESDTLNSCMLIPRRFNGAYMITDNWGGSGHGGGHYDGTCGQDSTNINAKWRVHAPNPSDGQVQIYENSNAGNTEQLVKYSTFIGVSQTHETSSTVSSSTSMEIGGAFKAFSASVSTTIENSWTTTDTSTYEASKKIEHDLTIPPRTRVVLKQLTGYYDGEFTVGDDSYTIEEHPMDSGATRTFKFQPSRGKGKTSEKEEL